MVIDEWIKCNPEPNILSKLDQYTKENGRRNERLRATWEIDPNSPFLIEKMVVRACGAPSDPHTPLAFSNVLGIMDVACRIDRNKQRSKWMPSSPVDSCTEEIFRLTAIFWRFARSTLPVGHRWFHHAGQQLKNDTHLLSCSSGDSQRMPMEFHQLQVRISRSTTATGCAFRHANQKYR